MKSFMQYFVIIGTACSMVACSHDSKNYHQGYCHQLSTQINSYNHSGLNRVQGRLNTATRSQLVQQYQAYGCDN